MENKTWDIFISHASEDKESFVKPLANILAGQGLNVWYDEFSLKLGDSLSESIDRGLVNSNYGVVIVSKAFIAKNWPKHELKGLVQLELAGSKKRIIPIWHEVTTKDVLEFSPTLADKLAANTNKQNVYQIALSIIEIVRPDVLDKINMTIARREFIRKHSRTQKINMKDSKAWAIVRHETLSPDLIIRVKLIARTLDEVYHESLKDWVKGFCYDTHPEREIRNWELAAAIYSDLTCKKTLRLEHKKEIFHALIGWMGGNDSESDFAEYKFVKYEQFKKAVTNVAPNFKFDMGEIWSQ